MCLRPAEQRTIDDFCGFLTFAEQHAVSITATPDCASQGRGGCDALIDRGGGVCAVEHTSLDSFHGQRHDDAAFGQVIHLLEEAIRAHRAVWDVTIGVPVRALPTERAWREALPAPREVVLSKIESMVDGERRMVTRRGGPWMSSRSTSNVLARLSGEVERQCGNFADQTSPVCFDASGRSRL
jgi:hypothetical protein